MFTPDLKTFLEKAKKGTIVPVYKEILADMETPVSAFRKIYHHSHAFLLESVEGGENIGRYSFLSCSPDCIFSSKGNQITITDPESKEEIREETHNPLGRLKELIGGYTFIEDENLPRFCGGAVGYIGYGMVQFFDTIPQKNTDTQELPDMYFLVTNSYMLFDHVKHVIKVVRNVAVDDDPEGSYRTACKEIDQMIGILNRQMTYVPIDTTSPGHEVSAKSNFTKPEFEEIVEKAKNYIREGDIIQVVLSQQFETVVSTSGFEIYRALRSINPSPYMYLLKLGSCEIIGASPEVMVRCEDGTVEVRPIAGTRPRGKNMQEDQQLEESLLADPKERAEHVMLVDLGRNDIGRVCDYGTVTVNDLMVIERYSHVMHIVSDVTGKLRDDKDQFDVVRAAFPAGTVTGAPKIRAMQIIDELENVRRGPYAGAVGYFSYSGDVDTCITIRTIVKCGNKAYIQAGAGIVADSVPENEYYETVNKAKAMMKAIALAETFGKSETEKFIADSKESSQEKTKKIIL